MDWEKFNIFTFSERKILWSFVIAAVILYVPLLIWNEWPTRDVASRYAPMAEAFARGDFQYAFHPRCQMMLPFCAGIISVLTGVSGLMACKITALIFFILGAFPLFCIARTLFGRKIAIGTVILYLFCFHIIDEMVVTGLRDELKSFFLLWISREFLMMFLERGSWRHYAKLGLACGLSICVRGELLFIATTVVFLCGVLDGLKNRWLWRTSICMLCAIAGASVEILTNLAVSGYAIPSSRFVAIFQSIFHADPTLVRFYLYAVLPLIPLCLGLCHATVFMLTDPLRKKLFKVLAAIVAIAVLVYIIVNTPTNVRGGLPKFFRDINSGCAPVFYPPALLGLLTILWQRRWNATQGCVLSLFFIFDGLVIGQIIFHDHCYYLATRYLLPAAPLILPWSAIGIVTLWELLKYTKIPFPRAIAAATVSFAILLSIYLSYRTEVLNHYRPKDFKDWDIILEMKRQLSTRKKSFYKPKLDVSFYKTNIKPAVFYHNISYYSVSVYLAGCSDVDNPNEADLIITSDKIGERGIRRTFGFNRPMRRIGKPVPSRRGNLIILEIIK